MVSTISNSNVADIPYTKSCLEFYLSKPKMHTNLSLFLILLGRSLLDLASVCVLVFSHVQLFAALWTAVRQAPLSMEFSRQEYWSGYLIQTPR